MCVTNESRAAEIERFVELSALASLIHPGLESASLASLLRHVNVDNVAASITGELFDKLWPEDERLNDGGHEAEQELELADARSMVLALQLRAKVAATEQAIVDHHLSAAGRALYLGQRAS